LNYTRAIDILSELAGGTPGADGRSGSVDRPLVRGGMIRAARRSRSAAMNPPAAMNPAPRPDHIRSFVNRRVHFTPGQRAARERLLPRFGVPYAPATLDAPAIFGRHAPLVLEIGFGMGETTAAIAQARPETDFLGVEVYPAGVGALLRRLDEQAIGNVRVVQHDAVEVLRDMIAPDSLAGVHVFFPDPWPKARHHKRRLIQPPLVALVASRLAPGRPSRTTGP